MDDGLIPVEVTVNQAGARLGHVRWVDPTDPDIAARLALGYLRRLPGAPPENGQAEESEGVEGAEVASPPVPDEAAPEGG